MSAIEKDWSTPLGSGTAGTPLTITITSPGSGTVGSTSTFTVDLATFTASAPAAASGRGTFAGSPTTGQTVTIGGSLVLTASDSTAASQKGTFSSPPTTANTITVVNGANTFSATTNATQSSFRQNFTNGTAASGSMTITYTASGSSVVLTMTAGASNTCSGTAGTFTASTNASNEAIAFAAAINMCPATDGVTATHTGVNTYATVTEILPGNFLTQSESLTNGSIGTIVTGTNGSATCTSSTTGTYATSSSTTTLASDLAAMFEACSAANAALIGINPGAGTITLSGANITVQAEKWGTAPGLTLTPTAAGFFQWTAGTMSGGTDGTTDAAHFAVDNVISDDAAALATAITDAASGVVTSSHTGTNAYLTLTAVAPGTGGNGITLATNATGFSWAAGTLGSGTGGVLGSDGTNSATTFAYWSVNTYADQNTLASNIATATSANTTVAGNMTAVASNNQVTFTPTTVGNFTASAANFSALSGTGSFGGGTSAQVQPNTYPAKYGASLTAADCNLDFVVYPTGQVGSGAAATIIAYNQLYGTTGSTGCGTTATVPSTYWAYNTGTAAVTTSPILSGDGSMVAFIQTNGTTASLVVLKWETTSGGTLTAPTTPTIASDITTCTAPCMTVTSLSADDTLSSPFYAYGGDIVFVGTDSGTLLRISPVFGAGAPVVSPPVTLNAGGTAPLASPVYDISGGCVFVGDTLGYLYSVDGGLTGGSTCGTGTFQLHGHSEVLAHTGVGYGIYDGPLVDSVAGTVYAFVTQNSTTTIGSCTSHANCVDEFITAASGTGSIATGSTGAAPLAAEPVGTGGATGGPVYPLYSGSFDNTYYTSANAASPSGSIYLVGGTSSTTGAILYRVPITANTEGASLSAVTGLTGAHLAWASPASEFLNGSIDYLFFSVNDGLKSGCTNLVGHGCIQSYNITTTTVSLSGAGDYTTPGTNGCWATGGIVIDNSDTSNLGSNLYFVSLNGSTAGGVDGGSPTSNGCTTGGFGTINAIQGLQSNP